MVSLTQKLLSGKGTNTFKQARMKRDAMVLRLTMISTSVMFAKRFFYDAASVRLISYHLYQCSRYLLNLLVLISNIDAHTFLFL